MTFKTNVSSLPIPLKLKIPNVDEYNMISIGISVLFEIFVLLIFINHNNKKLSKKLSKKKCCILVYS